MATGYVRTDYIGEGPIPYRRERPGEDELVHYAEMHLQTLVSSDEYALEEIDDAR